MRMHPARTAVALALFACLTTVGCYNRADRPATTGQTEAEGADHAHERSKMLIADAGKYHALLTAHLSPEGNELDIFFETADEKNPQPVAARFESFTAYAFVPGEEKPRELLFECAPADERPQGEKPGTCSHFVAKAPWLKPDVTLEVVAPLTLDGDKYRVEWKGFNPNKYAHHEK
jgi:hypothetical protein